MGRLFGPQDFALSFADAIVNSQKFSIPTKVKMREENVI
jgi:hypothetical protein